MLSESCQKRDSSLQQVKDTQVGVQTESPHETNNEESNHQTPQTQITPSVTEPHLPKIEPTS